MNGLKKIFHSWLVLINWEKINFLPFYLVIQKIVLSLQYQKTSIMKPTFKFIDFNNKHEQLRLAIENAIAVILRWNENTVSFDTGNYLLVYFTGEVLFVDSIDLIETPESVKIIVILETGEKPELTVFSTEEMINIYNFLFNYIK